MQDEELKEKEDYMKGYQNAIMEFQKQYNLRNKKIATSTPKDPRDVLELRREAIIKEVEKYQPSFSFENEMEKIKIYLPFNEMIRNMEYKSQIVKMLKMEKTSYTLNVQDDHPDILFGPQVEESENDDDVPPFYVIQNIDNVTLHNAMLDSGAYHNLMPKVIMEELGLDITRP
jgi:hypothetical protein